ncbi:hypothetical protein GCM10017044_23710 [Kordiimonas sediminis]|uniref:Uncharacterized protein n=1 Tax=Kordiimonas sediminis TaxID=1735581 RepID=A0A919AXH1_9PROT|nr:hypothetical protein GCM10017044_23710 [Kordiimonas sediminis]
MLPGVISSTICVTVVSEVSNSGTARHLIPDSGNDVECSLDVAKTGFCASTVASSKRLLRRVNVLSFMLLKLLPVNSPYMIVILLPETLLMKSLVFPSLV